MKHPSENAIPASVDFTGGFSGEMVTLFVDGKKIFSQRLTTDETTGLAGGTLINLPDSKGFLTVEIPKLRLKKILEVDLTKGSFIEIGILNGELGLDQRKASFLRD